MWREDLTGQIFGRLVVIKFYGVSPGGNRLWECKCICGRARVVAGGNLKSGNTSSCGCFRAEKAAIRARQRATHGKSHSIEYALYRGMIGRCANEGAGNYEYYGGRGIKVCARWKGRNGFANFWNDMGPRPSPQHSIERRDTNGPYAPNNCYWATAEEQAQNKRNTRRIELDGTIISLRKACRIRGISYDLVLQRVQRGWSIERAFGEML